MTKIFITLSLLSSAVLYSQASAKINNAQNIPISVSNPPWLIGADPIPDGTWRKYIKDDIRWETYNINGLASYVQGFTDWSVISNKPTFSLVATTGNYNDLVNKPTIPTAQVNSDWSSSTGVNQILNKPTALSSFTNDTNFVNGSSLSSTLSNYVTSVNLTTTLGGYSTSAALVSGLATKENSVTAGTTAQYYRGDKTFQTLNTTAVPEGTNQYFTNVRARTAVSAGTGITYNSATGIITNSSPDQIVSLTGGGSTVITGVYPNFTISNSSSGKRQITSSGTTDASGNYTLTFSPAFSVPPNIQATLANQGGNTNQFIKVVSTTTTSVTVNVFQRASLTVLGLELLAAAVTNVSGASVDLLITEK